LFSKCFVIDKYVFHLSTLGKGLLHHLICKVRDLAHGFLAKRAALQISGNYAVLRTKITGRAEIVMHDQGVHLA